MSVPEGTPASQPIVKAVKPCPMCGWEMLIHKVACDACFFVYKGMDSRAKDALLLECDRGVMEVRYGALQTTP